MEHIANSDTTSEVVAARVEALADDRRRGTQICYSIRPEALDDLGVRSPRR